ncbi:MAG: C45 family autoproteolytic acyltransferase/hydrolase [Planctomycetota bacterium]
MTTPRKTSLLLPLALTLALPAAALAAPRKDPLERLRDGVNLWRQELRIETTMVAAHLRGMLGPQPAAADWTPRSAGKGRLVRGPEGVPILYLEGTPEEMGRQHGLLLKREIGALRAYVKAFVGPRRMRGAVERGERLFLPHVPERFLRELRAMAAAAEMSERELLLAQWFADIYRGFACSTLAAPSAEGEGTFLARNLDFPTMGYLQRYSIVIVARPAGQRPFVSVGWPGMVGVLSGQNRSLAAATLVVHDDSGLSAGLPFQLLYRRVLEETDDVAGAEALLRAAPITVANNLMLADAGGGARVVELHPQRIESRGPGADGLLVATNHFVTSERRRDRLSFSFLSSRRRFRAVEQTCPARAPVPLARAREALAKASVPFTAQSMVFLPRQGAVEVAFVRDGAAAKGRFVRLERGLLLEAKAASAPLPPAGERR